MAIMTLPQSEIAYPHLTPINTPKVVSLAKAIVTDGLLNPILVTKAKTSKTDTASAPYRVIDGEKRLRAFELLSHAKRLPRSLRLVPCLEQSCAPNNAPNRPALKTDSEFVHAICDAFSAGASKTALMARFACTASAVDQALSLNNLNEQIMDYFSSGHLSLEQAAAFASLPNKQAQWTLLQKLGPFAHAADVISAILGGETVLTMPNGELLILPSREPRFNPASHPSPAEHYAA